MICGPILAVWAILNGDLGRTMNFPRVSETGFQVWFWCLNYFFVVLFLFQSISYLLVSAFMLQLVVLASCILAFFLNYTIFLNTTLNSPLTQTICGNLKVNLPSLFVYYLFFLTKETLSEIFLVCENFEGSISIFRS